MLQRTPPEALRRDRAHPVDIVVGMRMRKRRQDCELSMHAVGEAVGVTHQQIEKYEKAIDRLSVSRLWQIARVLRVPIDFFFEHFED